MLEEVETYFYYDWPIEFAAISTSGQFFLVQWVGKQQSDKGHDWLLLPVTRTRLEEIRSGGLEYREAFQASESGVVYLVHTGQDVLPLKVLEASSLVEPFLPPLDIRLDEVDPLPQLPYPPRLRTYEEAAE